MKLSNDTITILQNYASINTGLLVAPGNIIKTVSANKTILATAEVEEEFESQFCIYDLSQFLATLSLFNDPDIEFNKDHAVIGDGTTKVKYVYAEPSQIVTVPDQELSIEPDVEFNLTSEAMDKLFKGGNVLGLPNLVFEKEDGDSRIVAKATDVKNPTSNEVAVPIDDASKIPDGGFKMVFKFENIKLLAPGDETGYAVEIAASGIGRFEDAVEYFVPVEQADSKFN